MAHMHNGQRGIAVRLCGVLPALAAALSSLAFALIAAVVATPPLTAQAATYGSITIDAQWNRDSDDRTALAGDTYAIVRIASADLDAETGTVRAFRTLESFSQFDRDWAGLTSSELNAAAKQLDAYATKNRLYAISDTTNAAGRATFTDLEPGIYLIARTAAASANRRYDCDPFLVSVPETNGGATEFAVTAEPKFSDNGTVTPPNPTPEPEPEPEPEPNKPAKPGSTANTGAAVSVVALAAIALTVAALIIRDLRRERRDSSVLQ
ncbi:cell surface protein [Bifidobacterium aerophilum]|uniref:Cell surface protein n=1 Tax=Bifidobacterium aerophilum TaxID=1798155 RepID=A0A6N9Z2W1_9BIFI|nr:cell surface protein [Bifidobacterium aerophilum]NEG88664.1 cell surface protein [Bifidobacterium aerophilum]